MEDRQRDEAVTPRVRHQVSERDLHRVLDESLWQVERLRVDRAASSPDRS